MHETHILETKNVGLYTWSGGGRGLKKDGPLNMFKYIIFNSY